MALRGIPASVPKGKRTYSSGAGCTTNSMSTVSTKPEFLLLVKVRYQHILKYLMCRLVSKNYRWRPFPVVSDCTCLLPAYLIRSHPSMLSTFLSASLLTSSFILFSRHTSLPSGILLFQYLQTLTTQSLQLNIAATFTTMSQPTREKQKKSYYHPPEITEEIKKVWIDRARDI